MLYFSFHWLIRLHTFLDTKRKISENRNQSGDYCDIVNVEGLLGKTGCCVESYTLNNEQNVFFLIFDIFIINFLKTKNDNKNS